MTRLNREFNARHGLGAGTTLLNVPAGADERMGAAYERHVIARHLAWWLQD